MIYFPIILYIMFGLGYGACRRAYGEDIPAALITGIIWLFWLGNQFGRSEL
jgi:hypothetical protein